MQQGFKADGTVDAYPSRSLCSCSDLHSRQDLLQAVKSMGRG